MKDQLWGIAFSLTVHGMAGILLVGIGQEVTSTVKTVALDFSVHSRAHWGAEGSGTDSAPGEGAGVAGNGATAEVETAAPAHSRPSGENASSQRPDPPLLTDARQTPVLASGKPTPRLEPAPQSIEAQPPADMDPTAKAAGPPSLAQDAPSTAVASLPVRRIQSEQRTRPARRTPPRDGGRSQHSLIGERPETEPEAPAGPDSTASPIQDPPLPRQGIPPSASGPKTARPEIQAAAMSESRSALPDTDEIDGSERWVDTQSSVRGDLPQESSEAVGSGNRAGSVNRGEANGSVSQSDGASGYPSAHFNVIRGHLMKHLCFPRIARERGWSGKVEVSFTIYPDGRVGGIAIHRSCGIPILDKSALKTVESASPFPIPPSAARITIPILYELN